MRTIQRNFFVMTLPLVFAISCNKKRNTDEPVARTKDKLTGEKNQAVVKAKDKPPVTPPASNPSGVIVDKNKTPGSDPNSAANALANEALKKATELQKTNANDALQLLIDGTNSDSIAGFAPQVALGIFSDFKTVGSYIPVTDALATWQEIFMKQYPENQDMPAESKNAIKLLYNILNDGAPEAKKYTMTLLEWFAVIHKDDM